MLRKVSTQELYLHGGGIAIFALSILLGYWVGIRPIFVTKAKVDARRAESAFLREQVPQLTQENRVISKKIRTLEEELRGSYPLDLAEEDYRDDEPVLKLISLLLTRRNLDLVNFREQSADPGLVEVHFQTKGNYRDIVQLIYDFRTLSRAARITKFQLSALDDFGENCGTNFSVQFSAQPKQPTQLL